MRLGCVDCRRCCWMRLAVNPVTRGKVVDAEPRDRACGDCDTKPLLVEIEREHHRRVRSIVAGEAAAHSEEIACPFAEQRMPRAPTESVRAVEYPRCRCR